MLVFEFTLKRYRFILLYASVFVTPADATKLLAESTKRVLNKVAGFKPFQVECPIELDIIFTTHNSAEKLGFLKSIQRLDARTIRYVGEDMLDISRFIAFVVTANI